MILGLIYIERLSVALSMIIKPLYLVKGDIVVLNKDVMQLVKAKIDLANLTAEELGSVTRNYIKKEMEG